MLVQVGQSVLPVIRAQTVLFMTGRGVIFATYRIPMVLIYRICRRKTNVRY